MAKPKLLDRIPFRSKKDLIGTETMTWNDTRLLTSAASSIG